MLNTSFRSAHDDCLAHPHRGSRAHIIIGYYARQTRKTVEEMQVARWQSVAPHLFVKIDWTTLGPGAVLAELRNAGLGPSLDVDITIAFVGRNDPFGNADILWRTAVLMLANFIASGFQTQMDSS